MRKISWILVLSIILALIPNYAVNASCGEGLDNLKFEDIENIIMRRNPTVQINENTKKNLDDSIEAIRDARYDKRDLEDAIDGIDDAIDGLNEAVDVQEEMIDNLKGLLPSEDSMPGENPEIPEEPVEPEEPVDPENPENPEIPGQQPGVQEELYKNLLKNQMQSIGIQMGTLEFVKGLYEANIASLEQNRDALEEQLKEFDKLPMRKMELEKALLQIDMGNENIIWGAQNLYLGYNNMRRNRDKLVQSLELLDNQIEIMTLQEELGMIISLDLVGIKNQRDQMVFNIDTLETQMENLLGELNLMLGEEFDREIELEDTFIADQEFIFRMNYVDGLKQAKENSYSIKLKDYDYDIQLEKLKWADEHEEYEEYRTERRNLENAEMELKQEEKNLELTFSKAYNEVKNKIFEFENEKQSFIYEREKYNFSRLRYELGMISEMEFEEVKTNYDSQKENIITMEQDLFQVLLQYKALLKGMNFVQ